ncbi:MAG TPA: hypothetical protein VHZ55_12485 [Bryobacteraceae bacterium]|jgi:anti-sigma28 factor (negative regulator of flagellin synthesis)|nr:hypothetical protein [Bryobacteraceae bacterium]
MRIENQNISGVAGSGNSGAVHSADNTSTSAASAGDNSDDTVSLSSASNLIALSKTLTSADKQSRIANLTSQVQSGVYQPDLPAASRALINQQW